MRKKFEVVNFLDQCRWDSKGANRYALVNYAHKALSDDLKILTHWICYITDRQMPFEKIWDVGGFVFSDMLRHYKHFGEGMNVLTINSSASFFEEKSDGKYTFKSRLPAPDNNKRLTKNNCVAGEPVRFISRFYPSDFASMFYTLHTLEAYHRDFINYIVAVIESVSSHAYSPKTLIQGLAYGLYLLSYGNIGQLSSKDLNSTNWGINAKERTEKIRFLLSNSTDFHKAFESFFRRGKQYAIKRVWCCLRDYLKSVEFGETYLKNGLDDRGVDNNLIEMLFSDEAKSYLELPGDVWNNSAIFRKCLLSDVELSERERSMAFNKLIRILYEREKIMFGYPEQFDTTFDFVPRMCERDLCNICPFMAIKERNNISNICSDNEDKYCTVAMIVGGYFCMCKPEQCLLKDILAEDESEDAVEKTSEQVAEYKMR